MVRKATKIVRGGKKEARNDGSPSKRTGSLGVPKGSAEVGEKQKRKTRETKSVRDGKHKGNPPSPTLTLPSLPPLPLSLLLPPPPLPPPLLGDPLTKLSSNPPSNKPLGAQ